MSIFNHSPYQVSISTSPYHQLNSDPESLACKHSIPAFPLHQQSLLDKDHHEPNHHDCAKHHTCHTVSLRQLILPGTMIALVALFGLLAWSCVNWHGWSNWEVDNLVRRGSPFVMPVWMGR